MPTNTKNISVATTVLCVIASCAVLYVLRSILLPFVLAGLLAVLFKPVVQTLRRWRIPMGLCVVIVLAVAGGALYGIGAIVYSGATSVVEKAPEYSQRANTLATELNEVVRSASRQIYGRSSVIKLDEFLDQKTLSHIATSGISSVVSLLGDFFLVLLFLVFMVSGGEYSGAKLNKAFPGTPDGIDVLGIYRSVHAKILNYLGVKTMINVTNGAATWLILIMFGTDFAALMGVLSFLLHYLPNIGSFAAVILPGLVTLLQTGSITHTLLVVGVLSIVGNILGNIVEPKVMGSSLDLSPVLVLFSLVFWGWMWGIIGMILSVPIMAIIKTILENFEQTQPLAILMGNTVKE
jgi:AI-2 transport protein TqsA